MRVIKGPNVEVPLLDVLGQIKPGAMIADDGRLSILPGTIVFVETSSPVLLSNFRYSQDRLRYVGFVFSVSQDCYGFAHLLDAKTERVEYFANAKFYMAEFPTPVG